VVIDDVMAQSAFGTLEAVGRQVWVPNLGTGPFEVVGVVGHVRHWGLAGDDQAKVRAQLYYPFAQVPDGLLRRWSELMSIIVRTSVPPLTVLGPLRAEVRGATNDQVLYQVRTLEQLAANSISMQRFLMLLFGIFAALSLLLACIGIYGVLAYLTSQRVPEFGVRLALGATAQNVVQLVLRQSLAMILIGVGAGIAVSLAAARVLERLVEGMQPGGIATFAVTIAVLVAAGLFASFLPARRAGRIDPVTALRQE
jgi:putative ABC transport system permease protein